jgi:hypothetical protein
MLKNGEATTTTMIYNNDNHQPVTHSVTTYYSLYDGEG